MNSWSFFRHGDHDDGINYHITRTGQTKMSKVNVTGEHIAYLAMANALNYLIDSHRNLGSN